MSHRLQVLIPPDLDVKVRKAAQRSRVSKGEWVRRAIARSLAGSPSEADPVTKLSRLKAPTGDIRRMLAEIEVGRR